METNSTDAALTPLQAEVAKIKAERGEAPVEGPSGLSEALSEAGIEHTTKPKEEAAEDAPALEGDGAQTMLEAARGIDPREVAKQEIKDQALAAGYDEKTAHALGFNTPREIARNILEKAAAGVQSGVAEQSATPPPAPSAGSPAQVSHTEVQAALEGLADEKTASVVAGLFEAQSARLAELERAVTQTAQVTQAQQDERFLDSVRTAASELRGEFPWLVRDDGSIDPEVGRDAAALMTAGTTKGDVQASMRKAALLTALERGQAPRQSTTATAGPDTTVQQSTSGFDSSKPLTGAQVAAMLSEVERKYAGDTGKIASEYARIQRLAKEHNARV